VYFTTRVLFVGYLLVDSGVDSKKRRISHDNTRGRVITICIEREIPISKPNPKRPAAISTPIQHIPLISSNSTQSSRHGNCTVTRRRRTRRRSRCQCRRRSLNMRPRNSRSRRGNILVVETNGNTHAVGIYAVAAYHCTKRLISHFGGILVLHHASRHLYLLPRPRACTCTCTSNRRQHAILTHRTINSYGVPEHDVVARVHAAGAPCPALFPGRRIRLRCSLGCE